MSANLNSRFLSRIGLSQEVKDLEFELLNEIQNRASEISEGSECIERTRRDLSTSVSEAGKGLQVAATGVSEDLDTLNEIAVFPVIDEIDFLNSLFEVEIFNVFGYVNSVTSMFSLLVVLESEVRTFGALFEYFVNEVYVEMIIWSMLADDMSLVALPQIDNVLVEFRSSANSIRSSLTTCS